MKFICDKFNVCGVEKCKHKRPHKKESCIYKGRNRICLSINDFSKCIPVIQLELDGFITEEEMQI